MDCKKTFLLLIFFILCSCHSNLVPKNTADLIESLKLRASKVRNIPISEVEFGYSSLTGNNDLIQSVISGSILKLKTALKKNSVYEINDQGLNALELAILIGDTELVIELLCHCPDIEENIKQDLIWLATWAGNKSDLNRVLLYRLKKYYKTDLDKLSKVIICLNREDKEFLIQEIIDVDWQDEEGMNPLYLFRDPGLFKKLIRKGYSHKCELKDGSTLLHYCTNKEKLDILKFIIKDIDIHKSDFMGQTALHLASQEGELEVCRVFIEKGANPHLRNCDGKSAIDLAKNDEVKAILNSSGHRLEPKEYFEGVLNKKKAYFSKKQNEARQAAKKDFNNNLIKKISYGYADFQEGRYNKKLNKFYYQYHFGLPDDLKRIYIEAYNKEIERLLKLINR